MTPPSISIARFEITSLAFMLVWVPEPVCQTTSGKWSSSLPAATSAAAAMIASAISAGIARRRLVRIGQAVDETSRRRRPSGWRPIRWGSF
jgi:hypothetical protein